MKGKLTKKRYRCATIFVDHYSRLRFIHLQIDDSSVKTVAAKCTLETFAAEHGIKFQHYHCDNGHFSDNAFKQACHEQRQQLTFCGVNAHFQKWHSRMLYGERTQAIASRARLLAAGSALCTLAIRPPQCRTPTQQPASAGEWHIEARAFQLNSCWLQHEACAHFWLPCFCTAERTCIRESIATMVTSCAPWAQS